MRVQLSRRRDEGAVAIFVAILSVVLIGMAAFAVDFGNAYAAKRQLSVAADAAALDAARAVAAAKVGGVNILGGGKGCTTWSSADWTAARAAATAAAGTTNTANDLRSSDTAHRAVIDSVTVTCPSDGTRVEVTVANSRALESFFGGVFGADSYHPARSATAAVRPRLSISGLRPYAVCYDVVNQARGATTSTFTMVLNKPIGVCNTTAPGQWGVVDFDGGSNPTGDTVSWTQDGYPNQIDAPDPSLPADPGMPGPGALTGALDSIVDQVVLFPVVTQFTGGSGNNASFNLVGFVGAKVCGYRLNNKSNAGSCYDVAQAGSYNKQVDFIQFRYVTYTGGYTGQGPTCTFTDPNCTYAILGAQLYR